MLYLAKHLSHDVTSHSLYLSHNVSSHNVIFYNVIFVVNGFFKYIAMHFVVLLLSNPSAYMRAREQDSESETARARESERERTYGE